MRLDPLSGLHFSEKPGGFLGRLVLFVTLSITRGGGGRQSIFISILLFTPLASTLCPWIQMLSFSIDMFQETVIILYYSNRQKMWSHPQRHFTQSPSLSTSVCPAFRLEWRVFGSHTTHSTSNVHPGPWESVEQHWYSESTRWYSLAFLTQIKFSVEAPTAGLI